MEEIHCSRERDTGTGQAAGINLFFDILVWLLFCLAESIQPKML